MKLYIDDNNILFTGQANAGGAHQHPSRGRDGPQYRGEVVPSGPAPRQSPAQAPGAKGLPFIEGQVRLPVSAHPATGYVSGVPPGGGFMK